MKRRFLCRQSSLVFTTFLTTFFSVSLLAAVRSSAVVGPAKFSMKKDASLAFAKLLYARPADLTRAECTVFVNRPEHRAGVQSRDPMNRVDCAIADASRVLLPNQVAEFRGSPVESWGSQDEASFTVRGAFAQTLWEKLHKAVWEEFTGRRDASIYFPIVSCLYHPEAHAITECSEIYTIDRAIDSPERAQVFCTRKTTLAPGATGVVAGYDMDNPALSQRKVLSDAIDTQLKRAERNVESHACIFLD